MAPDLAEAIALKALKFLAESPDNLNGFQAASGINGLDLRNRIEDPQLLAGVIDFLLKNEELLIGFCQKTSTRPRDVHLCQRVLSNL